MKIRSLKRVSSKEEGFSLIELLIVLGVVSFAMVGVMQFQKDVAENTRARNAGIQFLDVGNALGNYIAREPDSLSSCLTAGAPGIKIPLSVLTQSSGATTVGSCSLPNIQLLPSTTSNINLFNTGYDILVRKNDSGNLTGLVLSDAPIIDQGMDLNGTPKYSWIGKAMEAAGPQSGMTFSATGANSLRGLGGGWAIGSSEYSQINKLGLFGYRVAYQGNNDDIYLRLDGAFPMRGNLNMGNFSINNATDINFNGWLNGNNALLNNLKTGYIHNSGSIVTDSLQADQAITTGNLANNPMPTGWGDSYIHTWNIYAEGTIATGQNGRTQAYMDNRGLVKANNILLELPGCTNIPAGLTKAQADAIRGKDCTGPYTGMLSDRLPKYVSRGVKVVRNNEMVDKPNCTSAGGQGAARIILTPQIQNTYGTYDINVDFKAHSDNSYTFIVRRTPYTWDQIQTYAIDNGSRWQVKLGSYSAAQHGAAAGWQALAEVFCDFG